MNNLLNYFFPIVAINPTPQASTAFLKQVCVVVKPKSGVPSGVTMCTTMGQIAALTDNTEAEQLFNAGLTRVFILTSSSLSLSSLLAANSNFFTLLISSDFSDSEVAGATTPAVKATLSAQSLNIEAKAAGVESNSLSFEAVDTAVAGSETASLVGNKITVEIEAGVSTFAQVKAAIEAAAPVNALVAVTIDSGDESDPMAVFNEANLTGGANAIVSGGLEVGTFKGVVGVSSADDDFLGDQATIPNRVAFHSTVATKAKNLFYAFGKLLSNQLNWLNQQYIDMPFGDDINTEGMAQNLFDANISFVLSDDQYGKRLSFFVAGGKAIVAPYIARNLEIDMQSRGLSYISGNQPQYTLTQASLLEDELQKVIEGYKTKKWLERGEVLIKLEQSNFVASGYITISEPKGLWRIFGQVQQT